MIPKPSIISWERIRMVFQEQDKKNQGDNMFRMEAIAEAQRDADYDWGLKLVEQVRAEVLKEVGLYMRGKISKEKLSENLGMNFYEMDEDLKSGTMPDEVKRNTKADPEPGME